MIPEGDWDEANTAAWLGHPRHQSVESRQRLWLLQQTGKVLTLLGVGEVCEVEREDALCTKISYWNILLTHDPWLPAVARL